MGTARLSFTARIEGAHSDRAASASKKDGLAAPPSHPSEAARCASTGDQQAALSFPSQLAHSLSQKGRLMRPQLRASIDEYPMVHPSSLVLSSEGSLVDPRMRASNEHLLSVRVLRAGGRPGYPLFPLFEQPPKPRLNLVQPLAQVGLKNIGLGLHHPALGLELVLEQHQLGE